MPPKAPSLAPPILIDTQAGFNQLLPRLRSQPQLAVDTEANSLFAYQEQVCLIQITAGGVDYIIDPLSIPDISALGGLFQDREIEKIFHASEYDIIILHEDFGFEFQNLFDTMLAAQILGRRKLGLDALLEEVAGVKVNKKYQRSDWGKRPLPEDMLRYAQIDTHYLAQVRDQLAAELVQRGLVPIAREDFARACQAWRQVREDNTAPCWKIKGARKLSPRQAAVLAQLCDYREGVAKKLDRPVFKVIGANTLLKLAEHSPTTVDQMMRMDLPGKRNLQRHAEGLLSAIQQGLEGKPLQPPRKKRLDESYLAREQALRGWRKGKARQMNVNSAVVLPRDLLYDLVAENPASLQEMKKILADVPWRLDRFGDELLAIIQRANKNGRER